ncbi:MAG: hypothetical protein IKN59_03685 [Paludibacteraceae bacterium]|nr:hypothetical protein [Paludibacteraceae bacterium]
MSVLLLTGCEEPVEEMVMPITISMPISDSFSSQLVPDRRVMGDPGTKEQFALPNYIYYFIAKEESEGVWKVSQIETATAGVSDWVKKRYLGPYDTEGDSVYQYTEELHLLLEKSKTERFNGRVYIVASAVELTFDKTLKSELKSGSSLDDLLNLKFTMNDGVKSNLQNIYSTPYNYNAYGAYYGSFYKEQNVPHLNLVLYHVAAKVDLMWNVADDMRIKADPSDAVRLTYMKVQNLYAGPCYVFKPMRNKLASKVSEGGYAIDNIVTATDEGRWWEGRYYFYAIPYVAEDETSDGKVYFPLQMVMRTNGSGDNYQPTLNMQIDTTAVFVPWLRANFNLTQPLEDKIETKFVD